MNKNTQRFTLLETDFYQIAMSYVFIMENKANDITGYEGFIRNIKSQINPKENFYYFRGHGDVVKYIEQIKMELQNPDFINSFISLIENKIEAKFIPEFIEKFNKLNTEFEYNVVNDNTIVFPYIPVFQFKGPRWIGQLIETAVTNIYNGQTGYQTLLNMKKEEISYISNIDLDYISSIVYGVGGEYYSRYTQDLETRAAEFREVDTDGILLEAGFRRAPSKEAALIASNIALRNMWNGTSNTTVEDKSKVGGTMAHAFVMSYKSELESFIAWDKYFPNSTILIDTYDTLNAVDILINNNIKPMDVRIDSGDFFEITNQVRQKLDDNGWEDVGIFLSGDISPEMIYKLKANDVKYTKLMAGTYYVYCNEIIKKVNSGFVYKIVEYQDENNTIIYPEKKSVGKKNYTGLKIITKIGDNKYEVTKNNGEMEISNINSFNENTEVIFN